MIIKIYNTLTRKKEILRPIKDGEVKIYVCGPTVYDLCHIGHARSAVFFDVVVNYLRNIGFKVTYVRNFTDIDDKIIERSKSMSLTYQELSQRYIDSFQKDMKTLNVKPASFEPRVSDHIDDIINIIKILISNEYAYVTSNGVYFSVDNSKSYGKLSGRDKEDMLPGNRVKIDNNKNNPLDFVLWKYAKAGEPSWQSPWGSGRPGWHIECSAMSYKLLGQTIDIHGGGKDLIFPHHENEIAQSESAHKVPLANYWMHNGLVNINNEKMSKSTGNLKFIKDITKSHNPEAVRLFLLSSQYRNPIEFSQRSLDSYDKATVRIRRTFERAITFINNNKEMEVKTCDNNGVFWSDFCESMNNDFNVAKCIGILFDSLKQINKIIDEWHTENKIKQFTALHSIMNDVKLISKTLGVLNLLPNHSRSLKRDIKPQQIEKLINDRNNARINKDWKEADRIRNYLENKGISIEDRPNDTVWNFIKK